ncbi:NADP-dependent oxidoreductase domain-containing protein 1-like [Lytechinus variegatus]|uniref:NADP-dependent oxidoreductase domain-containing protein 1-like n=1 Tax=Lytechinus variegatus TaxID=7654 RepID=UPI001BB29676|nr:NADP-dependent oxidoreductase domain-containing protein 1-like [Lytechinus variegatus]
MASVVAANSLGNLSDITKDLPSLQFENALSEDEKGPYLALRKRSHAITVSACAQAAYFVAVLNEARQKILHLKTPQQSKSSKFLQKAPPRDPVKIGIIGCGRIGNHLANCLLTYADVLPQELVISTRRPETLAQLKKKGIECFYDNVKVASSVHLLFLCVLPSQMATVADDICTVIPPHCTIYTFLSSVPIPRLRRMLDAQAIIRPEFTWERSGEGGEGMVWDCTKDVCITLENQEQVEMTCPLAEQRRSIVQTKEKWAEMVLYSFVNMCTREGLEKQQTIAVTNEVILGQSSSQEYPTEFRAMDFTRRPTLFPVFDMSAVAANQTPLTQTITENQQLRALFVKKYKNVFDKFYYWKGIKQIKPKTQEIT